MLIEVIKQLTKIKKKHGDIPILYMYNEASEMTLANLSQVCLAYTDLNIGNNALIFSQNVNDGNFLNEKEYELEKHSNFKPVVLITEKI